MKYVTYIIASKLTYHLLSLRGIYDIYIKEVILNRTVILK